MDRAENIRPLPLMPRARQRLLVLAQARLTDLQRQLDDLKPASDAINARAVADTTLLISALLTSAAALASQEIRRDCQKEAEL